MDAIPDSLSDKARAVLDQGGEGWEYFFFAQTFADEVEAVRLRQLSAETAARDLPQPVVRDAVFEWVLGKMDDLRQVVDELDALFDNDRLEAAFAPVGQPADPEAILVLSQEMAAQYGEMLTWAETVRATPVERRCTELREELAGFADPAIAAVERYGPFLQQQLRVRISGPDDEAQDVSLALELEAPETDRLLEACRQVAEDTSGETSMVGKSLTKAGYLYLLVNPSMEGLVKIGRTARSPKKRARELSEATGVPTPFILVFDAFVEDCVRAERFVHNELELRGYRVSEGREFFQVAPTEAIHVMQEAGRLVASG